MIAGPTWNTTHVYGQCQVNHAKKLLFVKIPKCASSWCDNYLSRMGQLNLENSWAGDNFQDPSLKDYQSFVVLRNPIDRWISVMPAPDKIMSITTEEEIVEGVLNNLDNYINDEHLAPQYDFIAGLNIDQTIFFNFESNLGEKFSRFLKDQGLGIIDLGNFINQGISDPAKYKWAELLKREDFIHKIKHIYRQDYALINSIKFWT